VETSVTVSAERKEVLNIAVFSIAVQVMDLDTFV